MSEQVKRERQNQLRDIVISAPLFGALLVSFSDEGDRLDVEPAGKGFSERARAVDGTSYRISASLQLFNGFWVTARTESGNEAKHGLEIHETAARSYTAAPKRVKDKLREIILVAVNAHFEARPELVAAARAVAKHNAVARAQETLASAKAAVAKAEAALAAALKAEAQS